MSHRLLTLSLVVLLVGAGLALVQLPVHSQADGDLDKYDDAELRRYITAELTVIYERRGGGLKPDVRYSLDVLKGKFMYALSDEGDAENDEADDDVITLDELEDELEELGDGTTLEEVIDEALREASTVSPRRRSRGSINDNALDRDDLMASWLRSPTGAISQVNPVEDLPLFRFLNLGVGSIAQPARRASPRDAINKFESLMIKDTRKKR